MTPDETTHYSPAQLTENLAKWAQKTAKKLPMDRPYLMIYSGMSGVALATALSLAMARVKKLDFAMMYVRKSTESAHSGKQDQISYPSHSRREDRTLLFVDDLIDSGDTFERCLAAAKSQAPVTDKMYLALSGKTGTGEDYWTDEWLEDRACTYDGYELVRI